MARKHPARKRAAAKDAREREPRREPKLRPECEITEYEEDEALR